ncbi:MAG: roadblock/LC7 domain-containing protein [Phormidesmis sp.]
MAMDVQKIQMTLQNLVSNGPDIQGAALVTLDGLPLASTLPSDMDEERVSAMAAAMLSIGERIGGELQRGEVGRVFVEGGQGYCMLTNCGQEAVLLVLAAAAAKQGLIQLSIKQAVAELKMVLA